MKKFPSVTVLVTVKNAKDTIKKCINSLLRLNYPNYTVYVTDAFSTDGTWEILEKMKKKYKKKLKIERVKGNIAKAHNYMMKKVKSKFIAFTDADCIVHKNWLKNLISAFTSKEIIASAGFCSTPKNVNPLQKLIGKELENRFRRFPKFISRAPTMNLCVRTKVAKKIKFDEKFDVAQETDWGYRLTKKGKMIYVPKAKVYHYHRPTLKSFFKQQFKYGKATLLLYLKHKRKITGDHITTSTMIFQEFFFSLSFLFLFFSIFEIKLLWFSFFFILLFFFLSLKDILSITNDIKEGISYLALFFFRSTAWTLGFLYGLISFIKLKI